MCSRICIYIHIYRRYIFTYIASKDFYPYQHHCRSIRTAYC